MTAMLLLLVGAPAWTAEGEAEPIAVELRATLAPDLRTIEVQVYTDDTVHSWVDPLAHLPVPPDDRTLLRTWRGRPRPGHIDATSWGQTRRGHTLDRVPDGADGPTSWGQTPRGETFVTRLPVGRFGDVGTTRRGLYANGAWYPQPLDADGGLPTVRWDVTVDGPEGVVIVVGDAVGEGSVHWEGVAERAPLAAVRRAEVEVVEAGDSEVVIVSRRPRRIVRREPARLLDAAGGEGRVVVVEGPLRRRLARPGPGVLYLSDRAWRLTPGLRTYHDGAVQRGLLAASQDLPDPFERALAADVMSRLAPAPDARGLLRWFSWNPVVDAILNDRRLPFWGDVFQAAHPEDPLRDDLVEVFQPHGPTSALAAQLGAAHDDAVLRAVATALRTGAPLPPELAAFVASWRRPYPAQDLVLDVGEDAIHVERRRTGPDEDPLPTEVVEVRLDGEIRSATAAAGEAETLVFPHDGRPGRVIVDPRGLVRQTDRKGDAWPPRAVLLTAAWIDAINLTEGFVSGHVLAWARGRDDNRNVVSAWLAADQQSLPEITLGWLHRRGPLQDGLSRPHRLSLSTTAAWSNPAFAEGDRAVFTLGGTASYAWDTRISALFPLRGQRLGVSVGGGLAPQEGTRWGRADASATGVVSPHPRWALAGRGSVGVATGDTRQRLMWLGGPGAGVSLPPGIAIGTRRAVGMGEVRWAPVRNASLPLLGLAWLSEVQLTAGAEGVVLHTIDGEDARLVGVTGGAAVVTDLLGASPALVGATVGVPAVVVGVTDADGQPVEAWDSPQVTVRFSQAF